MRLRQTLTALGVATAVALPALVSAAQRPDPAKGKAMFTRVGCAGCHSTDGHPKGNPPNPDLSHVGKKFSAAQIAVVQDQLRGKDVDRAARRDRPARPGQDQLGADHRRRTGVGVRSQQHDRAGGIVGGIEIIVAAAGS